MLENALGRLAPDEAGAVWLGLVVAFVVFGDMGRLRSARNVALVGVMAFSLLFIDILEWSGTRAAVIFLGVFSAVGAYSVWGLVLGIRGSRTVWSTNLSWKGLRVLLFIVLTMNVVTTLGRFPNDAGYYTNLGAQRWTETGVLPYADALLKGPEAPAYGAAATYGPLLYVAHIPMQLLLGRQGNARDADPKDESYRRPPVLATKLTVLAFYALALFSLYTVVRRRVGAEVALGAVVVFAATPYISGLGGEQASIMGLTYVSHMGPTAVVLAAFALLPRPLASGAMLAAAGGVLFYPAFMFPAWLGWYFWKDRRRAFAFFVGFALMAAAIVALIVLFTPASGDQGPIALFLESTLEHQEGLGQRQYGASTFSFWGTHPNLASFWQAPLIGTGSLFKPSFLIYALFVVTTFFLVRGRSDAQLAGILASLAASVQLWKTHATGSYVEWWLPLLLISILTCAASARSTSDRGETANAKDQQIPSPVTG